MSERRAFEWDDAKALNNLAKHKIEFEYGTNVFLDPRRVDLDASRTEDRETRRKIIGLIEGRLFTVVYTVRGRSTRIISARRSNAMESKMYGSLHA
ncbi:MAG TPA: BrnT family toxin [Rhodopila sp.]|nr:BrnT family toxin [Rhodopila sp.]